MSQIDINISRDGEQVGTMCVERISERMVRVTYSKNGKTYTWEKKLTRGVEEWVAGICLIDAMVEMKSEQGQHGGAWLQAEQTETKTQSEAHK